jgi:hypothetical protein
LPSTAARSRWIVVSAGPHDGAGARRDTVAKEDQMIDRTSLLLGPSLLLGGVEMMQRRLSGSRLMCAGLVVTLVGLAIGLMATYEIDGHWMTAVVGVALLLGGALRRMLAHGEATDREQRPG